jgi:hypothetical protein
MNGKKTDARVQICLPPFIFGQAGRRWIEFQVLPGRETRALREKTMRQGSFSGSGGQALLSAINKVIPV